MADESNMKVLIVRRSKGQTGDRGLYFISTMIGAVSQDLFYESIILDGPTGYDNFLFWTAT
jgi:hypothetical protein